MRVISANPTHRDALVTLFQAAGNRCFCRWWHFEGDDYAWQQQCAQSGKDNQAALEEALQQDGAQARGLLAIDEHDRAVGWLKLCPSHEVSKLYRRRLYRGLACLQGDRAGAYVVACLLVHPQLRRQGVARALLSGAIDEARRCKATYLEALPRHSSEPLHDEELPMGPAELYRSLGFAQIDGPDPYPVLRLALTSTS